MRVFIGNYDPNGGGGVNTHISQILQYSPRCSSELIMTPFNFRKGSVAVLSQSLHEFVHLRNSPYVRLMSRTFSEADVVHTHASLFALYAALYAKRDYSVTVVATHHTAANPEILRVKGSLQPWHRRVFYRQFLHGLFESYHDADAVIAVAKWVQRDLKKYWGIRAEYIPNMVDPDEVIHTAKSIFVDDPRIMGKDYVVWLGARLNPPSVKRPQDFVAAAKEFPDIPFVIVGKGITEVALRHVVQEIPKNLVVIDTSKYGYNHRAAFLNVVSRAKLAVMTSYYETMPYALLEALALGIPVVVPDTGGPPEVVSPGVGRVYETANVSSLCSVLEHAYSEKYDSFGISRYLRDNYSLVSLFPRLSRLYCSIS